MTGLTLQVGFLVGDGVQRLRNRSRQLRLNQERLALELRAAQLRIVGIEQDAVAWNGIRKFTVRKKLEECADTFSFYLEPHDGKPLPPFRPGQYLTFRLKLPGTDKPLVRCYSLSDCARPDFYRVSIKRCLPAAGSAHPPGIASTYFCDVVKPGDILDVKAPSGHFSLEMESDRPVVLIGGGIGVTPMISMANALLATGSSREIWFFFGVRNSTDHMFKATMAQYPAHRNLHLHVCYSKPLATDQAGRDYHHEGRVTVALFKSLLRSNNYDYYLCGPGPFMESITSDLRDWGVPDSWVHFEAFGPSSVKRAAAPAVKDALDHPAGPPGVAVNFAVSARTVSWTGTQASLLELAEANGVKIDAGCRAGNCGSCLVAIKSGDVDYIGSCGSEPERGSCLACICKPRGPGPLVVEA